MIRAQRIAAKWIVCAGELFQGRHSTMALRCFDLGFVFLITGLLLVGGAPFAAHGQPSTSPKSRVPTFADYRVKEIFTGAPAPLNTQSHRLAREFRVTLSDELRKGANFAGHFTLVAWRCGQHCQTFAIIDAKTGEVFAPTANGKRVPTSSVGYKFVADSKLLIINPIEALEAEHAGSYLRYDDSRFYVWENNSLKEIYKLSPTRPRVANKS